VWLSGLTRILFTAGSVAVSVRSLILAGGGLFLLTKSVLEIHRTLEGPKPIAPRVVTKFPLLVLQIVLIDLLFSFDSIFTAVGVARPDQIDVMIAAIIASMFAMLWLSGRIGDLIEDRCDLDQRGAQRSPAQAVPVYRHGVRDPGRDCECQVAAPRTCPQVLRLEEERKPLSLSLPASRGARLAARFGVFVELTQPAVVTSVKIIDCNSDQGPEH
jgi:hypothetical protein